MAHIDHGKSTLADRFLEATGALSARELREQALGKRIIARETIKAYRKDVITELYGGDYTRKMKLLEKQKPGKKRMRVIGRVEIPQEAFLALLEIK